MMFQDRFWGNFGGSQVLYWGSEGVYGDISGIFRGSSKDFKGITELFSVKSILGGFATAYFMMIQKLFSELQGRFSCFRKVSGTLRDFGRVSRGF